MTIGSSSHGNDIYLHLSSDNLITKETEWHSLSEMEVNLDEFF